MTQKIAICAPGGNPAMPPWKLKAASLEDPRIQCKHIPTDVTYKFPPPKPRPFRARTVPPNIFAGLAHVNVNEFFEFSPCHNTRGHKYKLFKHQTTACVRSNFFCERVVNVWNSLPDDVSFDSFYRFRCSIMRINLSSHLRYCGRLS